MVSPEREKGCDSCPVGNMSGSAPSSSLFIWNVDVILKTFFLFDLGSEEIAA